MFPPKLKHILQGIKPLKIKFPKDVKILRSPLKKTQKSIGSIVHNIESTKVSKALAKRKLRPIVIYAAIVIAVLLPVIILVNNRAEDTEAAWFDETWRYRQRIPITNAGTAQTDFQVQIEIDTASLISSGKLQSDCDDIRFVDNAGNILSYFQATACDDADTRYWVKIKNLPVATVDIYMYYGNNAVAAGSDRDNTFDLSLLGTFSQTHSNANIAPNHGASSDRETNFYISNSSFVNRFNSSWVYQQQYGSLDIYTGLCYDDKLERFYGIDWTNKQWSTFSTSFVEQSPQDNTLGDEPIDCGTDSSYLYTNNRTGLVCRNSLTNNSKECINMDTLSGFDWGGQGMTYAFGYLFAGTTSTYGANGNRIYVIDVSNWYDPRIITYFDSSGHSLTEVGGLTWKDKYIYQTSRSEDFANAWTGPVKTAATEPTVGTFGSEEESEGPLAYYKLDEGTGFKALDSNWRKTGTATNLVGNPSFEADTAGWTLAVNGGTWSRVSGNCAMGDYCLRGAVTSTGHASVYDVTDLTVGATYTVSVYMRSETGSAGFYVSDTSYAGPVYGTTNSENTWKRSTASRTVPANGTLRIVFYGANPSTNYYDGIQLESGSSSTLYCDADQTGNGNRALQIGIGGTAYECDKGTDADILNGTRWVESSQCISGSCLRFDGTDDYINTGVDYSWSNSESFSFSFWVRPTSDTGNNVIFGKGTTGSTWEYSMRITGLSPSFTYWSTSGGGELSLNSAKSLNLNQWHHIVITYNGSAGYMYVDGSVTGEDTSISAAFQNRTNNLTIGLAYFNSGAQGELPGFLDEFKIYNRYLSAEEVKKEYASGGNTGSSAAFGGVANNTPDFLTNGLVGHWPMDDGYGTGILDYSSSGNNGVLGVGTSVPQWTTGRYAGGLSFDGTNDEASVADPGSGELDFGTGDFSYSLWFKTTVTPGFASQLFYKRGTTSGNPGYNIGILSTNKLQSVLDDGLVTEVNSESTTNVNDGNWHNVVVVHDRTNTQTMYMYVDGVLEDSDSISGVVGSISHDNSVYFGRNGVAASQFFNGILDDVRLYNRALSESEAVQIYNTIATPKVHYDFDDNKPGNNPDIGLDTIRDKSGNNVDASITDRVGLAEGYYGPGKFGSGYNADGSARFVEVADQSAIDLQDDFSMTFWIRPQNGFSTDSDRFYGIMDKGSYTVFLDNTNGKLTVETSNGGTSWAKSYETSTYRVDSLAAYNDRLYAGLGHTSGADGGNLHSYDGSTWSLAYDPSGQSYGLSLGYYRGNIYFGAGLDTGDVYRYNGTTGTATTFPNCVNTATQSFQAFNGLLYAGAGYYNATASGGGDVCVYNGTSWSKSYDGLGVNEQKVFSLMTYNGYLYSGNFGTDWGDVNEFNGASWTQVYDGDSTYGDNFGMGTWDGYLWILNGGGTNQATSVRYDPVGGASVISNGIPHTNMTDMVAYNGIMYASTSGGTGDGDVFTYNGTSWATSYAGAECAVNALAVWRGDIYAGQVDCTTTGADGDVFVMNGGDYVTGSKTSWTDDWHHITITKSGTTLSTYVNGILDGTGTVASSLPNNANNLLIGSTYGSRGEGTGDGTFKGGIDEVKIYDYVLTTSEIFQDMNTDHPRVGTPVGATALHLRLDEGYGGTANDISPNVTNGTLGTTTAAPTWTNDGKFGKALSFDGGDHVAWGSAMSSISTTQGTFSTWFKTSTAADGMMIYGSSAANANGYGGEGEVHLAINPSGQVNFFMNNAVSTDVNIGIATVYTDGQWHHAVATWDVNTANLYIDGQKVASAANTADSFSFTSRFYLGRPGAATRMYTGLLDEVKVYPFALTEDEVKTDYNYGKSASLGSISTTSAGVADNSAAREYCVPGSNDLCNSPVAEYKLDENTGTTVYDTSSNSNNGTFGASSAAPAWAPGIVGGALSFTGTQDDTVTFGDVAVADFGTSDFSLSGWIKTSNNASRYFVSKRTSCAGSNFWNIYTVVTTGVLAIEVSEAAGANYNYAQSSSNVIDGQWHHFTYVRQGAVIYVYVDGVLETTDTGPGTANLSNTNILQFGDNPCTGAGSGYTGLLDNFRIYDYARTSSQVAWEYSKGAPVAHYKFDECEGTTIYNSAPTYTDSAAGTNGTLTNSTVGTCSTSGAWANGSDGQIGSSLEFAGDNDYIAFGTSDFGNFANRADAITLTAWFKADSFPADSARERIISSYVNAGSTGFLIGLFDDSGQVEVGGRSVGTDSYQAKYCTYGITGEWTHLTGMLDFANDTISIYLNGKLCKQEAVTFGNSTFTLGSPTTISSIGSGSTGVEFFDGLLDEVRIYNYGLTPQQVKSLYNNGSVRFD